MIDEITPDDLKSARRALGLTQEEVASALGYKDSTVISLYESGKRPIASFLVYRWNHTFPFKLGQVVIDPVFKEQLRQELLMIFDAEMARMAREVRNRLHDWIDEQLDS